MTRSIPDHWIARIFSKMGAIYGDSFTRKWAATDLREVRETWQQGLAGHSEEALKRGLTGLFHEKYPPDLPRFIELCRAQPAMYTAHQFPSLTHEHRVTDAGYVGLAKVREIIRPIAERAEVPRHMTGIEWAFKILREADENSKISLIRLGYAQEAIKQWCTEHHCIPEDLDADGKWKHEQRSGAGKVQVHAAVILPPLVPSPHIYREPGEDDE